MLVHFFSADGWQSWGLSGEPLVPERMPVLFDDDFVFKTTLARGRRGR
ncbi:hypothetical protein [Streptomyces javensis]